MVEAAAGAARVVNRKARLGTVVSDRGDQTIIVAIERAAPHRLYHKVIRRTRRYPVHDPENTASVGDVVRIEECRPISKTKRWRLVEIVKEREVAQVTAASIDASLVSEVQRSAARAEEEEGGAQQTEAQQATEAAAESVEAAAAAEASAEVEAPVESEATTAAEVSPEASQPEAEAPTAPAEDTQTESEQQ
jgi:small subunit ribosomal protein S17